jgi:hypothetical protein
MWTRERQQIDGIIWMVGKFAESTVAAEWKDNQYGWRENWRE